MKKVFLILLFFLCLPVSVWPGSNDAVNFSSYYIGGDPALVTKDSGFFTNNSDARRDIQTAAKYDHICTKPFAYDHISIGGGLNTWNSIKSLNGSGPYADNTFIYLIQNTNIDEDHDQYDEKSNWSTIGRVHVADSNCDCGSTNPTGTLMSHDWYLSNNLNTEVYYPYVYYANCGVYLPQFGDTVSDIENDPIDTTTFVDWYFTCLRCDMLDCGVSQGLFHGADGIYHDTPIINRYRTLRAKTLTGTCYTTSDTSVCGTGGEDCRPQDTGYENATTFRESRYKYYRRMSKVFHDESHDLSFNCSGLPTDTDGARTTWPYVDSIENSNERPNYLLNEYSGVKGNYADNAGPEHVVLFTGVSGLTAMADVLAGLQNIDCVLMDTIDSESRDCIQDGGSDSCRDQYDNEVSVDGLCWYSLAKHMVIMPKNTTSYFAWSEYSHGNGWGGIKTVDAYRYMHWKDYFAAFRGSGLLNWGSPDGDYYTRVVDGTTLLLRHFKSGDQGMGYVVLNANNTDLSNVIVDDELFITETCKSITLSNYTTDLGSIPNVGSTVNIPRWSALFLRTSLTSNNTPNSVIDTPAAPQSVSVGDTTSFTGHGVDAEDGNPATGCTHAWDWNTLVGAYSAETTYNTDNCCTYDSKTWRSKIDSNTGNTPAEDANWTRIDNDEDPGNVKWMVAATSDYVTYTVTDSGSLADPTPASVHIVVAGGMDWTDSIFEGAWLFENNGNDSSTRGANLTTGNSPTYDSEDYKEGSYSVDFQYEDDDHFDVTDATAGCPLKSSGGVKSFTFGGYVNPDASGSVMTMVAKYQAAKYCFKASLDDSNQLLITLGYNSGASLESHTNTTTTLTSDGSTWYGWSVGYDNDDKSYFVAVFNASGTLLSNTTGTATLDANKLSLTDADFCVGANSGGTIQSFNGKLDCTWYADEKLAIETVTNIMQFNQGGGGEGNDWTDSAFSGVWLFNSGALTTDSSGNGATLVSGNSPVEDSENYKEGNASVSFQVADNDNYTIADASLPAGFATKSGGTDKSFTWGCELKPTALNATQALATKYATGAVSWAAKIAGDNYNQPLLILGYNSGASQENIYHTYLLIAGYWYYGFFGYDNDNKSYIIRLYDANRNHIGTDKVGIATLDENKLSLTTSAFSIAANSNGTVHSFGGNMDMALMANRKLTTQEMDDIMANSFGGENPTPPSPAFTSVAGVSDNGTYTSGVIDFKLVANTDLYISPKIPPTGTIPMDVGFAEPVNAEILNVSGTELTLRLSITAGMRSQDLNWETGASLVITDGWIRSAGEVDVSTSLTGLSLADVAAYVVAAPKTKDNPWRFGPDGNFTDKTAADAAGWYPLGKDEIHIYAVTENQTWSQSGSADSPITIRYMGPMTGDLTISGDYYNIWNSSRRVSGTRADSGSNNTWKIEHYRRGWGFRKSIVVDDNP